MFKHKKISHLPLILVFISLVSCGSSREASSEDLARLDKLVEDRYFEIETQRAMPLATNSMNQIATAGLLPPGDSASQINIQGDSNYFKFEGDTVSADLPYFGERQMGGGYNQNTGIEFKGVPKDLEILKKENKNYYTISFNISHETENYQISLKLYPNLNALIYINSSDRFSINYRGKLETLNNIPKKK